MKYVTLDQIFEENCTPKIIDELTFLSNFAKDLLPFSVKTLLWDDLSENLLKRFN